MLRLWRRGGVFQFVMQQQRCTFPEAVRFLAERAGVPVPRQDAGGPAPVAGSDRQALLRLMRWATDFYRQQLAGPAGAAVLSYARGRGLTDESIERFELGYAPEPADALCRSARSARFTHEQLLAAGLIARGDSGGHYDRFRHRLVLPITDANGRVIAFGGRALTLQARAKYLNSPETILFDKSSNLYGLSWARKAIADSGQAVIVEGYFDALLPAQMGVGNVVATLGTALTDRHVRMLSKLAGDVVLLFDSDRAGAAAAERGLELFIAQQVNVRIAAVPDGKDPCDYVLAAGGEALARLVADAPDALTYAWRKRSAEFAAGGDLVAKRQAAEGFLKTVVTSTAYGAIDPVRQGLLVNQLAHLLGVSADQLTGQVRRLARRVPVGGQARQPVEGERTAGASAGTGLPGAQRRILEVLIAEPGLFDQVADHLEAVGFVDPVLSAVAREVWRLGGQGRLSLEALLQVQAGPDWGRVVTDLAEAGESRGNYAATLAGDLQMVERQRRGRQLTELRRKGDDASLRELTERLKSPDARRRPW